MSSNHHDRGDWMTQDQHREQQRTSERCAGSIIRSLLNTLFSEQTLEGWRGEWRLI
jgi:hypothetical protein